MRRPATHPKLTPRGATSAATARQGFPVWLMAALLALVTIVLYWPATGHDFVNYDDTKYVLNNPHVTSGLTWQNGWWALTSGYAANWHPVTWLFHMLDCQMFGLHPWGHHLTSVLLHALNALLIFALLQQMTGARWRSLVVAALFALHPLHVESVAWVAERKDVLSACFGLLALIAYARYTTGGRRPEVRGRGQEVRGSWSFFPLPASLFYLLSLCCVALGLMSKPMLVTWPFVMLLLDYWPLQRLSFSPTVQQSNSPTPHPPTAPPLRLLVEKVPFFALAAAASIVTFVAQKRGGSVLAVQNLPLGARIGNALVSYCRYLGKLFWPTDLAVFYPHPGHWPMEKVLLAGGLMLGTSGLLFVLGRRAPFLLMGWLWFCGTLVPVIGLVQVGDQAMADRYSYIPSLGVLILAVWGAYELSRRWHYAVMALPVASCSALALCFALTRHQLEHWKNTEALFRHALAVTKNNWWAHNNVGSILDAQGQFDEAIRQYQAAIRLKPDYPDAYNNLGNTRVKKGQLDEAIRQYQEAIRLEPDYSEAHYNLGNALGAIGQIDEAIRQYQETIRLKPDAPDAHNNLGIALGRRGQIAEAIRQFQEAIRLRPDHAEAHYNLGTALGENGQTDEAIRQYQEAIRLKPNAARPYNKLGLALCQQGRTDEAIRQFQQALRLEPDYADARKNLDTVLATKADAAEQPGDSTHR